MVVKNTKSNTDKKLKPFQFGLIGKLLTSIDSTRLSHEKQSTVIDDNFKTLKNMRYHDNGIRGVRGMSKINSTALSTHPKIRNIHQFTKSQPAENHIIVQAFNGALTESKVLRNDTAIPSTGDFSSTALHTDASGAATGRFASGRLGRLLYCNGEETLVWGGNEARLSQFVVYDPNGTFLYDYTDKVQNVLSDASNVATLKQVSGIGSETKLLLHCNGTDTSTTITDDSPTTPHIVTAVGNTQIDTALKVFGTAGLLMDGTGDWATVPDDADFDLSGGVWTFECWVRVASLASDVGLYSQAEASATQNYIWIYIDTNGAVNLVINEADVAATGTVTLDTGASGSVDSITVNSIEVMSGSEAFDSDLDTTATAVAANITAHTSSPNYTASATGAVVTITADRLGADVNGFAVVSAATTITTTDVNMASGASSNVVSLATPSGVVATSATVFTHVRVVENGNDYFVFVNGVQKAHVSDASRAEGAVAYDSTVFIGATYDGTTETKSFNGSIDELRLTTSALSTTDFDVPASEYTTATTDVNIRIGNILPVAGFNFTVSNANTATGTLAVFYWSSTSQWTAVTNLTDNTATGGIPLAKTGTVTFDETAAIARQKIIDGVLGYWFKIEITNADAATAVSNVTVIEPFQDMKDFWDGDPRIAASVQLFEDSINKDNTVNVFEDDFTYDETTKGDLSSYMVMDSLTTSTEYLTVGFSERIQGVQFKVIPNHTNTTANTVMDVEYWNGTAWVSVGAIDDGTIENSVSFTKSGFVTWNPKNENVEFRKEVNKEEPLYYYKVSWSQSFTSSVLCYYISGIPVQKQIEKYSFPLSAQGRTWFFSNQSDKKNTAITSSVGSLNSFNGADSVVFEFGDESSITAATEIFTKLTTGAISDILVAKNNSMYLISGNSPDDWVVTQVSGDVGCPAPLTLKPSPIGIEFSALDTKQVVIWQSENGIMLYDSTAIFPISDSISDIFDQSNSYSINLAKINNSYGFWDNSSGKYEYHWMYASGSSTTLDKEMVFDLRRQKWWEASRGSVNALQCGLNVIDTNGAHYNYGTIDSGFLQRLENGTSWTGDGSSIAYEFQLGDLLFDNDIHTETLIRNLKLVMKTKSTTSSVVTVTHYGDMNQTGKTITLSPAKTGYDAAIANSSLSGTKWGRSVFHRLKFTISTNDETIGFEPLWVGGYFEQDRLRLKD
jgi:hypothetical protein